MDSHAGHEGHHGGSHHSGHGEVDHGDHDSLLKEMPSVNDVIVDDPHSSHHHHQGMEMSAGHMMMMMYFHGGYDEVILFDVWRINSVGGLIGSMFAIYVMGIVYEGLKFWREHLMRGNFKRVSYDRVPRIESGPENGSVSTSVDTSINEAGDGNNIRTIGESPRRTSATADQTLIKVIETNMLSIGHLALTLMHFVQLTIAYFLMLIVMTFNSWLCLAVVLGSTTGYFLFGWRKSVVVDVGGEHCH